MRNLATAFLLLCCALSAQSPQATISGSIRDPQGAVVIGAEVSAKSIGTDATTAATTNEAGFYSLRNLPIGEYQVTVTQPGFRRYERKGLVLTTGQSLELDIALEVGQVTETVSVTVGRTSAIAARWHKALPAIVSTNRLT